MSHELDQKIQDVYKRIQTERQILTATQTLRQASRNSDVLRKNEAESKEIEKRIRYFEDTLQELQARKQQADPGRSGSSSNSPNLSYASPQGNLNQSQLQNRPNNAGPPPRPKQYSNLDLVKSDTPLTPAKISRMLHTLEFKLQVEKQYKVSIDKMTKLYQADGDKKSRAEAESQRIESERKITLLEQSMKRYRNLRILDDEEDEEEAIGPNAKGERKDNLRNKPLSGKLLVTVIAARELNHAPTPKSRSSSKASPESIVSLKVEGTQLARTHPSRTDRWNEAFEIPVDKANEVEIVLYDRQGLTDLPVGLLWVRISDLVEAQRRQKVGGAGDVQGGWVTANAMGGSGNPGGGMYEMNTPAGVIPGAGINPPQGGPNIYGQQSAPEGIHAWFGVQPAGAIELELEFVKENIRKRPLDAGGLGRQGAVRKRKDEVHEKNGHNFVQRQFYQLMRCAFCSDYLLNALGYQCEDCKYTCHKKCFEKVVTKCISKSNTGEDEEKLNHRIPHRFEPLTNISANWCCHCGYVLPLGRKNARQCSECRITCHAGCAHLVPDLCGMPMEVANTLLREMKNIGMRQSKASAGPPKQLSGNINTHSPTSSMSMPQQMDKLAITTSPVEYNHRHSADGRTAGLPASTRLPPGAQVPPPPRGAGSIPPPGPDYPHNLPPRQQNYDNYPSQPAPPAPPRQHSGLPSKPHGGTGGVVVQPPQHRSSSNDVQSPAQNIVSPLQPRQSARRRKVGLDDFNFLAVLGKGNFGKVMLAEEKKTSGLFAIKVLKKDFIIDNDEVESTRSEKRVFLAAAKERHPFLLGLHSCFQTETRVYFVMEYVSGGDLMLHIQRKQFSLRQAKFYASEVLLALQYFHLNGIVYRDLKLDNILLTLDGHVKVADYGLCKEEMWYGETTSTFCGTPEFMAPEILLEQRYGRAVDWWAFGVLTYEMLLGQSPFRGDDEDEIFDAILEDEPLYPITMPRDAVSILQKLLTRDPLRRLGSGESDAEEIKKQPFFKDVNWDDVFHKRIPPPYFPTIKGSADTSNFDEEFTKEQPTLTPVHGQLSAKDQREFSDFSWVAHWADI